MRKGVYLLIIAVTFYLNVMYDWNMGGQVLAAEVVFLFFCLVMAVLGKRQVNGQIKMEKTMLEQNEICNVQVRLKNRRRLSMPVKLQVAYRNTTDKTEEKRRYKVCLEGRQEKTILHELKPETCGRIEIYIKKITCYDILGLFGFFGRPKEKVSATVIPKPYPVNLIISSRTKWFPTDGESYAQDRKGEDHAEIYDVREYHAGDRMQKVHWKLSAREDVLYVKEFSYPLGAAVVVLLEEDAQGHGVGSPFMEAVISILTALLAQDCAQYVAWKKKEEDEITRVLIRKEEELYECVNGILEFSQTCLETNMEERYRYRYKNDTYSTMVKIDTGMHLQINEMEKIDMMEMGLENFFHTVELVV